VNKLALRLGVYGGLLAFAGNALVSSTRDPTFDTQTPQQVIQMSLVWFGFTALVCSVVGWGIWALATASDERRLAGLAMPGGAASAPVAGVDMRSGEAGQTAPGAAAEEFPPEATAQAVRQALREDAG